MRQCRQYAYEHSMEGFEQLAQEYPDQFRIVHAEPQGQGPNR
ncbi:Hypothetical protein A7982_02713 [Minicystis rosea]|nr:Hypothetical protein A7982_02713 [Minicystis rosea]